MRLLLIRYSADPNIGRLVVKNLSTSTEHASVGDTSATAREDALHLTCYDSPQLLAQAKLQACRTIPKWRMRRRRQSSKCENSSSALEW